MPVILEEDFDNTVHFIREVADGITVIIPHLEMFNGGFHSIAESDLWAQENMGADTALASPDEVREYLRCYGHRRLMFGSDFPFGDPYSELQKVRSLQLDPAVEAAVLGGNFLRLQARVNHRYLISKYRSPIKQILNLCHQKTAPPNHLRMICITQLLIRQFL
jgi:hypothetical protein